MRISLLVACLTGASAGRDTATVSAAGHLRATAVLTQKAKTDGDFDADLTDLDDAVDGVDRSAPLPPASKAVTPPEPAQSAPPRAAARAAAPPQSEADQDEEAAADLFGTTSPPVPAPTTPAPVDADTAAVAAALADPSAPDLAPTTTAAPTPDVVDVETPEALEAASEAAAVQDQPPPAAPTVTPAEQAEADAALRAVDLGDQPAQEEGFPEGAVSAAVMDAAQSDAKPAPNYRDGFNRPVLAKPYLKGRILPPVWDIRYEESRIRAATAQTTITVLAAEQPKMVAKLKENAAYTAKKFGKSTALANANQAVMRAQKITEGIVQHKAAAVCGSMSNLRNLPSTCSSEALGLFKKVLPIAQGKWQGAAAEAGETAAVPAATSAAFKAVMAMPQVVAPPVGYDAARTVFTEEFAKYKKQWEMLSNNKMIAIEAAKDAYWSKARAALLKKVKAEVTKAVWDAPVKAANNKIIKVVKTVADRESKKAATNALAPQFAAAAKKALTDAVRSANGKYMQSWSTNWGLNPMATQGGA